MENRTLTTLPELTLNTYLTGEFAKQFSEFWKDTFIYRDELILVNNYINEYRGLKGEDEVVLVNLIEQELFGSDEELTTNPDSIEPDLDTVEDSENPAVETVSIQPEAPRPVPQTGELVNSYLVLKDTAFEILKFKESSGEFYSNSLNNFTNLFDADVEFTSIIIPSQIEFIEASKYKAMSHPQKPAISTINSYMNNRINTVDAYSILEKHKDEYIYFRTDHHWTALGAYYVYQEFAKSKNFEPLSLNNYSYSSYPGFLGTLYGKTQAQSLRNNPDSVDVYISDVKSDYIIHTKEGVDLKMDVINLAKAGWSNKYLMFIGGDEPLGVIKTDNETTNRKIVVLKDSYANAFIPYLQSHYKEIHIVDPRHYKDNIVTYIKNNEIDEVLFFNYYVVVSYHTGFARNINRITQDPPPVETTEPEDETIVNSEEESNDSTVESASDLISTPDTSDSGAGSEAGSDSVSQPVSEAEPGIVSEDSTESSPHTEEKTAAEATDSPI